MKKYMQIISDNLFLVKPKDFLGFIKLFLAIPYAIAIKKRNKKIWLLCERKDEARDNAFVFFKYLNEKQDVIDAYYAIDKKSADYNKVKKYEKKVINFGSVQHYAYYLACDANISSVKNMGPNDLIGFVFRKIGFMNSKMCFLQHGTIKNDLKWLYYDKTKFKIFCCSAIPEYDFVRKNYGYPEGSVIYNGGQSRFDELYKKGDSYFKEKYILVMPTWRKWLKKGDPHMVEVEGTKDYSKTVYFKKWKEILNSSELIEKLENTNTKLVFYPHPTMQSYVDSFKTDKENIIIAKDREWDLQRLIRNASMLLTDYSSVFFDFVYMGKPIISYQFDLDKFTKLHYEEGYLPYDKNPFLHKCNSCEEVITGIYESIDRKFKVGNGYLKERDVFFPTRDNNNNYRIYENIYKVVYIR